MTKTKQSTNSTGAFHGIYSTYPRLHVNKIHETSKTNVCSSLPDSPSNLLSCNVHACVILLSGTLCHNSGRQQKTLYVISAEMKYDHAADTSSWQLIFPDMKKLKLIHKSPYLSGLLHWHMIAPLLVQCGAVITRSILSQIFTKDSPWLAR